MPAGPMPPIKVRNHFRIQARSLELELGARTLLMGILNVTPDSFYDGGRFMSTDAAIERAWEIVEQGADILDIGGESSRPGSAGVTLEEELCRVTPVLEALAGKYPLPISIDTTKTEVARAALECGATIVNDISSLSWNQGLGREAARFGAAMILMHMRGRPANMQQIPPSDDILLELERWAEEAVARARECGVSSEKIVLDPGLGFGKTSAQNFKILRNLDRLAAAGYPLLVGTSRKSFTGSVSKDASADRIWGTAASVAASIIFGAHILRVHDVAEMREVANMTDAIINERHGE
jgi:dihydropteroate synthase